MRNLLDPDNTIRSIHIAAGLGASSAHTWLKLPVVDELERVMEATTLPTLLLGGDPDGDPQDTYASWGKALLPAGARARRRRALLFPPDGDVAAAVDVAAELVHGSPGRDEQPTEWFLPRGSRREGFDVLVDDLAPGLAAHRTAGRHAGRRRGLGPRPAGWEYVVVPLSGSADVACTDPAGVTHRAALRGRASFRRPTDVAYVPAGLAPRPSGTAAGSPDRGLRSLVRPGTATQLPAPRRGEVPVELRGAGHASREVRNFGVPGVLEADAMIACEVVTPAGNWSSYPPHKHDEEREGIETQLEEIYYFETQAAGGAARAPTRLATSGSTAPPTGRSTSSPRCAPVTSSWCPTAGTVRRWRRPATTCTT